MQFLININLKNTGGGEQGNIAKHAKFTFRSDQIQGSSNSTDVHGSVGADGEDAIIHTSKFNIRLGPGWKQ